MTDFQEDVLAEEAAALPPVDADPVLEKPVVVPKNINEVASQLAFAKDDGRPFADKALAVTEELKAGRKSAVLSEVWEEERQVRIEGARNAAQAYLQARDAERAQAAIKQVAEIETMPQPSDTELERIAIGRAIEAAQGPDRWRMLYRNFADADEAITEESAPVAVRNMLLETAARFEEQASPLDKLFNFFSEIFSFGQNYARSDAVNKALGTNQYGVFSFYDAKTDLTRLMNGLTLTQREALVKELYKMPLGWMGLSDNPQSKADFFRKLATLTKEEAVAETVFDVWAAADFAILGKALAGLMFRGAPARAVARAGDQKAAANLVAEDLLTKAKVSGLNDAELVSKAIASGANPFDLMDEAAVQGMGAGVHQTMKARYDNLIYTLKQNLRSGALTPEEQRTAAQFIRNSYMQNTNPHVHTVVFGEAKDAGQDVTVLYQGREGERFYSKEAAEAWAARNNKTTAKVMPLEEAMNAARANAEGPLPTTSVPTKLLEVPDSAFNGDLENALQRVFYGENTVDEVELAGMGFTQSEITALENAGLATQGRMSRKQFGAWSNERSARLSGQRKKPKTSPAKQPQQEPTVSQQIAYHGGREIEDGAFRLGDLGTGQGGSALGRGVYSSAAEGLATRFAEKYGGRQAAVSRLEIPENDNYINWYADWDNQPAPVQKALSRLLDKDTLADAKAGNLTGEDLYRAAVSKFGDEDKAAKALDDAGVYGNYADRSGAHGVGPEHVTFNPERIVLKGSTPVTGVPKNKPTPKMTRDEWEEEMNKALADNNQARMDELDQVGFNFSMRRERDPISEKMRVTTGKSIDKEMFVERDNLVFDKDIDIQLQRVFYKWSKMLGMTTNKVRIMHIDKLDTLPYLYKELDANPRLMENIRQHALRNNGVHLDLVDSTDTLIIVNTQRDKPNSIGYITTMTHEFGHTFYFRTMNAMPKNMRAEWARMFKNWVKARNLEGSAERWVGEMSSLTEETLRLLMNIRNQGVGRMSELARTNPGLVQWFMRSDEFFAEQFAKYMLTEAKPVSVLERYFAEAAAKLKAFLREAAKLLGVDYSPTSVFFREWMDNHIKQVASGEFTPQFTSFRHSTAGGPIQLSAARGAEVPKPHIRPKLKQWVVVEKTTVPYSYSAIGKFSDKDIESAALVAIDPKHGASELAVESRVVGIHAEAKTQKALAEYIRPYYQKLNGEDKARVQSLLEEGDAFSNDGVEFGREFTYAEARAKGLSDNAAQAYLATRSLRMAMFHIRNAEMVRHLKAQGLQEIVIDASTKTVGRELSQEAAVGYVNREVFDLETGTVVKMSSEDMEKAYANGAKVFTLHQPIQIGKEWRSVVVGKAVARDIVTAIGYRPGEFSRIFTDEYFIKRVRKVKVDGEVKEVEDTIRTAVSAREADEFARNVTTAVRLLDNPIPGVVKEAELEKLIGNYFSVDEFVKSHAAGEWDGLLELKSHYTRNREEFLNGAVSEAVSTGRMFTSKRGERIYSVDRARQNTLGVFDSLQAEMTNVSRVANINEWRENMVRRWMNSFGHLLPRRTGDDTADFYAAAGGVFTKGTQESVVAERTHKYIMRQIGVRTDEEQYYAHFTRRLTENMFKGNVPIETIGAKIRQFGVLGFLRNINFNLNLGMFNPAQLLVQANGAATALALSPLHGLAAAKTFPLLRMAMMSDNPAVWNWFAKAQKLSDLGLSDAGEFISLIKAIRKTGIVDNLRSTSLWNMEDGKHNIFGGMGEWFSANHTVFFNRGEEFSRLVAFDVARREWKAANKGLDWTTENALKNIIVRADDLTQNMTKANLARFQEGAVSLPLQFAQYNIKLAANIISAMTSGGLKGNWTKATSTGRGFTKTEALQLMLGHIVLYGAAGNGLASLYDELIPEDARESMSVEQKTLLAQGLLAAIVNGVGEELTGERTAIAVGSRLGAFNFYDQMAKSLFEDKKGVFEALLGPTAVTGRRLGVVMDVASLWKKDENLTTEDVLKGLAEMSTEQVGTLRNAAKAYLFHMHNNKALSANNVPLAHITTPEVLAQALGFQPTAVSDVYRMIETKRDHDEALKDIATLIFKVQKDMMVAYNKEDYELAERKRLLLNSLYPTNAGDFAYVQRLVRDKVYPFDTSMDRMMSNYLERGLAQPLTVTKEPVNDTR